MIATKRDLERALFKKIEIQHWQKIANARSLITNDSVINRCKLRHKKAVQLDEGNLIKVTL